MLRHYSTVRTSVVTIALPVCVGVLGWVLSANVQSGTAIVLLVAELFLIVYALVLSFYFSQKTAQVRSFLVTLEADTHRPADDPDANEGLLYSSVASKQLAFPPKLDPIDWTLLLALGVLHVAFWAYYVLAVLPARAANPAYKPTDEEQSAVRGAVLASKEICGGANQVLAIRDLQIPTPVAARVDVTCGPASGQFGPNTYLIEKVNGAWRVTAPRITNPPAPPPPVKPKRESRRKS
jgi:hypothetical protein